MGDVYPRLTSAFVERTRVTMQFVVVLRTMARLVSALAEKINMDGAGINDSVYVLVMDQQERAVR
jgi:hypothetical protein